MASRVLFSRSFCWDDLACIDLLLVSIRSSKTKADVGGCLWCFMAKGMHMNRSTETLGNSPDLPFFRMRSEGFSFNSWGSGGRALFSIRCFYVRNRPQPFATVRGRALRRCHWGKLLQVTCQFATLFHCDLRENDMSRKIRDAFRCTGAAFCEILSLLRSSIGISVWRVVFLGCWMWPCHWDLRFRVWHRSSAFVTSLSLS